MKIFVLVDCLYAWAWICDEKVNTVEDTANDSVNPLTHFSYQKESRLVLELCEMDGACATSGASQRA